MNRQQELVIALFAIVIWTANTIIYWQEGYVKNALWFCSMTLLLFGIALILKNNFLLSTVITTSFVIEIIWTSDIISYFLTGNLIFGIADYIKEASGLRLIATFYHLFVFIVPIAITFEKKEFHKHSWVGAIVFFLIISIITTLITPDWTNINCVKRVCELGIFSELKVIQETSFGKMSLILQNTIVITTAFFIPTHLFFRRILVWIRKPTNKIKRSKTNI